jgi:hypothetical protein
VIAAVAVSGLVAASCGGDDASDEPAAEPAAPEPEPDAEPAPAPVVKPAKAAAPAGPLPTTTAEKIAWCRANDVKGS